jgi:hypothetical protein
MNDDEPLDTVDREGVPLRSGGEEEEAVHVQTTFVVTGWIMNKCTIDAPDDLTMHLHERK